MFRQDLQPSWNDVTPQITREYRGQAGFALLFCCHLLVSLITLTSLKWVFLVLSSAHKTVAY